MKSSACIGKKISNNNDLCDQIHNENTVSWNECVQPSRCDCLWLLPMSINNGLCWIRIRIRPCFYYWTVNSIFFLSIPYVPWINQMCRYVRTVSICLSGVVVVVVVIVVCLLPLLLLLWLTPPPPPPRTEPHRDTPCAIVFPLVYIRPPPLFLLFTQSSIFHSHINATQTTSTHSQPRAIELRQKYTTCTLQIGVSVNVVVVQ